MLLKLTIPKESESLEDWNQERGIKLNAEKLIKENIGLVHMVANRYRYMVEKDPAMDYEDLVSVGSIGLVKAVRDYDPSKGFKFSTFAVHRIKGEILRWFRDHGSSIKFSREVKEIYREIQSKGLSDADLPEISQKINLPLGKIKAAMEYGHVKHIESLNQIIHQGNNHVSLGESIAIEVDFLIGLEIAFAFKKMPKRNQLIHILSNHGYTQTEIGNMVGISQVQVGRVLRNPFIKSAS